MATITTISRSVGANRIVPTIAIPYPVGSPDKADKEIILRDDLVKKAIFALETEIEESTTF